MTLRRTGVALVLAGVVMLFVALAAGTESQGLTAQVTYGVSASDGDPGIDIHWVVCPGGALRTVELGGYVGGSSLGGGVPVYWQIRSDEPLPTEPQVETYSVGQTPPGFYETVPFTRRLPNDLVAIQAPPGGPISRDGMSFRPAELRSRTSDQVYRGDYEWVSSQRFERDGIAYCRATGHDSPAAQIALVFMGTGGLLVAGRRRQLVALAAGMALLAGLAGLLPGGVAPTLLAGERQAASAFSPGSFAPSGPHVIADLSPATARFDGSIYVARFLAPSTFSFAVSCTGVSVNIGEHSGIPNGVTGGRQLIGCNTPSRVRGLVADTPGRQHLVEVLIDPNGASDWRVLVLDAPGETGPFALW